ncbi:MAG: hypothetical protein AAFW00_28935, partial [Bacteroidota bacterium]
SSLWSAVNTSLGIQHNTTTAYNPEANGLVERFHRTLKAALMSRCATGNWFHHLPWVLLGLRTTPKSADDISPSERVFGEVVSVPGDFFASTHLSSPRDVRNTVQKLLPTPQTYKPRNTYIPPDLQDASHVFTRVDAVKPPLSRPYRGPYKIIARNQKALKLDLGNKHDWVSIDRCKPAYLMDEVPPIKFTRAGRPISMGLLSSGGSIVELPHVLPQR